MLFNNAKEDFISYERNVFYRREMYYLVGNVLSMKEMYYLGGICIF